MWIGFDRALNFGSHRTFKANTNDKSPIRGCYKIKQRKPDMSNFLIHIGAPRTGTTTLQQHIFPRARNHIVAQKKPKKNSFRTLTIESAEEYLESNKDAIKDLSEYASALIFTSTLKLATPREQNKQRYSRLLARSLNNLKKLSSKPDSKILISSERLCDTEAANTVFSSHKIYHDSELLCHTLCKTISSQMGEQALVIVTLRSPIAFLKSRYLRSIYQRSSRKQRILRPPEYIGKQAMLETNHPGTSTLIMAMHSELIKQLQRHAFVKAFGFQDLLASDDVFSLMGLQGEEKVAFRDFPRENKFPFTKEQERTIEVEITKALKQYGFYDRIMKAQMFE